MPLPVRRSKPGHVQLPVGDAGGDEHAVRAQAAAAGELDDPPGALGAQADRVLDRQQLGAEPSRLVDRAAGEVGAGQAAREAEVVLDPARHPRLAAGRLALDEDGLQALGRAVDRRGQSGGAAADDHEVVVLGRRARRTRRGARRARARSGARAPSRPPAARPGARRFSTPVIVSSSRASASRSTSSQRIGTRLRARKSRRSCESRLKRWPITRTPPDSSAAPASHVVSRSSTTGYSCSSGGSHGLSR